MDRRQFIVASATAGAVTTLAPSKALSQEKLSLSEGDVILFQGDSITDAGRKKKDPVANEGLGRGYPHFLASSLRQDYADLNLQVHNRGISGNKVPDLDRRWKKDCLDLEPRLVSILIGVNDIWHKLNGRYDGTAETYRDGFADLLQKTKEALPTTVLVVCEPFVLMSGTVKANEDKWFPDFTVRREYAKEVAAAAGAVWVPFQSMFDEAVASGTEAQSLAKDGVHPTPAGHQLMATTWRQSVGI